MTTVLTFFKKSSLWIWLAIAIVAIVVAPLLLSGFRLGLLAKYICLAMVAVGVGLAWGQGGMLTLGQGLFFGLGGYLMAMHLKLADAGPGGVPDFMSLYGNGELPAWWEPFRSPIATLILILVIPAAVAFLLGWAVFARRVRGAYFAILSQALVAAFSLWLVNQGTSTGGFNGITDFKGFFGYSLKDPANKRLLYFIAAAVLIGMVLITRQIMRSRFGELLIAVRDQENRVRFLGYNPAMIKTLTYTIAAVFAAIGGALFVPIVGIISPKDVGVTPSIIFLAGVVIGGRTTLLGPVLGTIALRLIETNLSETYPGFWTYFQGALFILVIAFLPQGVATVGPWVKGLVDRYRYRRTRTPAPTRELPESTDTPQLVGRASS
ncbi:urea ABC transporter permease subunit UrtC [Brooklawnia sp.]|uniref:urea ABC transporter permease subunit UrtC n=1 Tax=Brooklawnia sp. TaxID=2699740 RepID=UPI0031205257